MIYVIYITISLIPDNITRLHKFQEQSLLNRMSLIQQIISKRKYNYHTIVLHSLHAAVRYIEPD